MNIPFFKKEYYKCGCPMYVFTKETISWINDGNAIYLRYRALRALIHHLLKHADE